MIIQHCVIDLFAKSSYLFQDPKLYVQTILNVHKKYNVLVVTAFRSDAGFVAALDKVRLLDILLAGVVYWVVTLNMLKSPITVDDVVIYKCHRITVRQMYRLNLLTDVAC